MLSFASLLRITYPVPIHLLWSHTNPFSMTSLTTLLLFICTGEPFIFHFRIWYNLVPWNWYHRTPDLIPSYPGFDTLVPRIWYPEFDPRTPDVRTLIVPTIGLTPHVDDNSNQIVYPVRVYRIVRLPGYEIIRAGVEPGYEGISDGVQGH